MLAQAADSAISADPWRFQWHPEVWILVGFLTGAFVYTIKVLGPKAVPLGEQAVTRKNIYDIHRHLRYLQTKYTSHKHGT